MPTSRLRSALAAAALLATGVTCSGATDPGFDGPLATDPTARRVAACEGPARSLDAAIAAQLRSHGTIRTIDDEWADLAREVPGGFAGVLLQDGRPLLLLADPARAAEAKAALAERLSWFPVAEADVRSVRWSFAQLVEWDAYLLTRTTALQTGGLTSMDRDEQENRIAYGVLDEAARDRLVASLAELDLPCDLVLVHVESPVVIGR